MPSQKAEIRQASNVPLIHGGEDLPSVTVNQYNFEFRNRDGFIGDKASKSAFQKRLNDWRKRVKSAGEDPLGEKPTSKYSKKELDALFSGPDKRAAALIMGAVEEFSRDFADILAKYLGDSSWKGTERIVIGGGFKESQIGELVIARAMVHLNADGIKIDLRPIAHHPDDAGLIGSAHLVPQWMLKGNNAILAVDIGGTNIRAGVVELKMQEAPDLSEAQVWKSEIWCHANDSPSRTAAVQQLVDMLKKLISQAEKAKLDLAPVIGVGCPGIVGVDGAISRGGQNLPGGNWESEHFNLPERLAKAIPTIAGEPSFVIMHNDAVVQGLSQTPFMQDVSSWAVATIGTGLGNAHFLNKTEVAKKVEEPR